MASTLDDYRLDVSGDAPMANLALDSSANSIDGRRISVAPVSQFGKNASALSAGLAAGENGAQPYDATEAAVSIGGSTLAGAASGAAVAGPWGAVIGGGAALLTSSISAWTSVRAQRRRRRALEAIAREAKQREAMDRASAFQDKAYNAKQAALQGAALAYDKNAKNLMAKMSTDENLKLLFQQRGF